MAKINGGYWTFYSPLPSDYSPPQTLGPKITIRGIHFDGVTWTPIHLLYTGGAEISGNKVTNVIPFAIPTQWSGGNTLWAHSGIMLGKRQITAIPASIIPGAVTGYVIFENNEIALKYNNPEKTMGQGMFFFYTWGATIEIEGNTITNVSRNSIEVLDHYLDEHGQGTIAIENNRIITPTVRCAFPFTAAYLNGIVA